MKNDLQYVESSIVTLKEIVERDYFFNIPIYQRLYVWGKEQIEALLSDIWDAHKENKDVFYLGSTLVIERDSAHLGSRYFDLIDGQQRFTTLWLISLVWQESLKDYRFKKTTDELRHRIHFAIRPEVKQFFDIELGGGNASLPEARQLEDAMAIIKNFANDKADKEALDIPRLTQFIFEKVKLVFSEVPDKTDLNKLFEVINNRGVQLQHHEILKARLLCKIVDQQQRECYSQLWDACSFMGDYVEKNLKLSTNIKLVDFFDNERSKIDSEALASAKEVLTSLSSFLSSSEQTELSLLAILQSPPVEINANKNVDEDDYKSDKVRSIITFPMLLQHVLRIWLVKNGRPDINKILDKDLIFIFEQNWLQKDTNELEVKAFIELLWDTRYLFDKHVIKWVEDESDEVHAIRQLRKNEQKKDSKTYYSLIRENTDSNVDFGLLQSMLYHSQQLTTQHWLTPLLMYLLDHRGEAPFSYLKYLDNQLFCTNDSDILIVRTRKYLENLKSNTFIQSDNFVSELSEGKGVNFPHYWFYKLEYILWLQLKDTKGSAWKAFRITARNSVEHISPQTPVQHDSNRVTNEMLDCFGNLALVSRSLNSEYSNLPFNEKRQRFLNKNKNSVDSLKMTLIYEHEVWNDELASSHQNEMIKHFESYYISVKEDIRTHLEVTK